MTTRMTTQSVSPRPVLVAWLWREARLLEIVRPFLPLRPPVEPAMASTANPLQQVFDTAKREFKASLPSGNTSFRSLFSVATIDELYDVVERYQQEQHRTSKLRHLKRIQPLLERLKEYAGVIEVFVQVKPDILALLWGPIKLLLQWTSGWSEGFDAVAKMLERIGDLLPCFSSAVVHFLDVDRIKDVLGLFYRDILDFYLAMVQFFSLPRTFVLHRDLSRSYYAKMPQTH